VKKMLLRQPVESYITFSQQISYLFIIMTTSVRFFLTFFLFKLQSTARHAFHRFLAGFFKENFGL